MLPPMSRMFEAGSTTLEVVGMRVSSVLSKKISGLFLLSTIIFTIVFCSHASAATSIFGAFLGQPGPTLQEIIGRPEVQGRKLSDAIALQNFYAAREDALLWTEGGAGALSAFGHTLLGRLEESWTHGLNPRSYHTDKIKNVLEQAEPASRLEAEVLLADGFVRYAQDLSGMRVPAESLGLDPEHWLQPITAHAALQLLTRHEDIEAALAEIEPHAPTYLRLREELIKLAEAPEEPYLSVMPIDFGEALLKPAQRHRRIPDLRLRLGATPQSDDELLYDDRLAAAVIKFQRMHGLREDGVIGANTLRALNRTRNDRMKQIVVNLERLRWLDEKRPAKYVVVNIPSATLWAIEEGEVAFEMAVIVGRAKRATNSFVTEIKGVRFNPDWTVPPTIKKDDLWPKLVSNPEYLTDKGIEVYLGYEPDAETLDPASIDWASLTPNDLHALRMVQVPGAHNPLGRIRVLMPNRHNIYLHDTNERSLFAGAERAQSSGCIRMEYPEVMAAFIMKGQKNWDEARIQSTLEKGETKDYLINQPIPIYLLYYTVWADPEGQIIYGTDIYGEDQKLLDILKNIDGFSISGHN